MSDDEEYEVDEAARAFKRAAERAAMGIGAMAQDVEEQIRIALGISPEEFYVSGAPANRRGKSADQELNYQSINTAQPMKPWHTRAVGEERDLGDGQTLIIPRGAEPPTPVRDYKIKPKLKRRLRS